MKIVSWNVNGIASRRRSLIKFLANKKPDIVCVQEAKSECVLNAPGYELYWNLAERKGYAGTLVLTKRKPINCTMGIGIEKFNVEGRVITLEFRDFFVVNVYVPSFSTGSSPDRRDYRWEWDKAFHQYVATLPKPSILCGDFNVVRDAIDSYPESAKESTILPYQQQSESRENFESLLDSGFVDAFRALHPNTDGVYSQWGPKNKDRLDNRGSRLDYILVSNKLLSFTLSVDYHMDILGSDHCPVSINISPPALFEEQVQEDLAAQWQAIDWKRMQKLLFLMQKELAQAAHMQDWMLVSRLQNRIEASWVARALAVYSVASKNTAAGVDGIKWETAAEMVEAARLLTPRNYMPLPYRYIETTDNRGKRRIIEVLARRDQAMQVLQRFALVPIAESTADKRSFSGREGRSQLDAHAYLQRDLEQEDALAWILVIDVESFYGKAMHSWMIKHIPTNKTVLRKQLKAGIIKEGQLYDTEQGISLAGSLSPLLGNMMLDGLQTYIYDRLYPEGHSNYKAGTLTRFADDMVIYAETKAQASMIYQIVSEFLAERGLRPNPLKSYIVHINEGFNFLGRHYQKIKGVLAVTPSDNSVKEFKHELEVLILNSRVTYRSLIETINSKLRRWADSHSSIDAYIVFRDLDAFVEGLLIRRMCDRHPRWSKDTIRHNYFRKDGPYYVFVHPKIPALRIKRLAPLPILSYKPCKLDFNPFLDRAYFEQLKMQRAMRRTSGRYKAIWHRQDGRCAYCGLPMLPDQEIEVIERTIGLGRIKENLIYIHKRCRFDSFSRGKVDYLEPIELVELLQDLQADEPPCAYPYWGLQEYFRLCEKPVVSLTFDQIEKIIGEPLGWEANYFEEFWYEGLYDENRDDWRDQRNFIAEPSILPEAPSHPIADAWISQGYRLQRLHLAEKRVVFHRAVVGTQGLRIPAPLIQQRIPDEAAHKLRVVFQEVMNDFAIGSPMANCVDARAYTTYCQKTIQ